MFNALALLTGFVITVLTFMPPFNAADSEHLETGGVKIASDPKVYYPNVAGKNDGGGVLAKTDERDEIKNKKEQGITPILSEPETAPSRRPTPTSTPKVESVQTSQTPADYIMNQINSYRATNGLPPFVDHPEVCAFARTRLTELQNNFDHSGFNNRLENGSLPYSNFSNVAENIADAPSYTQVFDMWRSSSGHNQNLLSGMQHACVAGSGRLFVFESWSP